MTETRFGSEHKMFEAPRLPTVVKAEKPTKSVSSKKDQSKSASPKSPIKETVTANIEAINRESASPPEPVQVYNLEGEPVFIIVQVDLLKPLIKKKTIEETLESIQSIVPLRAQPTAAQQAITTCTQDFELCIKQLMHAIHNEFQIFYSENKKDLLKMAKTFLMHLHVTGAYTKMKVSIRESVEAYIAGAMDCPEELDVTRPDHQDALSDIYFGMVKKMCDTVNSLPSKVSEYDPEIPYNDLLYFAVEALEEGKFDKGQQYLLQRLENSKKADPQAWVDYAKLWLKKQEFEKAGECVKEAISIEPRFIPALFFQGLLSWLTEDYVEAEVFLLAVSSLKPGMAEGWIVLHMFHKQTDNQLLAKTELNYGKQSVKDNIPSEESSEPTLSWRPYAADPHRVFLVTASHLLRLSFPELAELALSYDLLEYGRNVDYLYYLSVCHYQQGRYEDSLKHLDEALHNVWEDGYLWALKGHNFYKLKKYPEASHAFDFALNFNLTPNDTCLINLRLGNILSNERAHDCYLRVCQVRGSPLSWQGLGISAFMNDELNDAELALNEANMLDCRLPRVWGYLALINLMWARSNVFKQCMSQAIRYGLDDPVLLERLNILGEFVRPTTHLNRSHLNS